MGDRVWETGLSQPLLQCLPWPATDFIITGIEKNQLLPLSLTPSAFSPSHHPPPTRAANISKFTAKGLRGKPEKRLQPPPGGSEGWVASHRTGKQLLCSVDLIWSLWSEVLAVKVYQRRLGQLQYYYILEVLVALTK